MKTYNLGIIGAGMYGKILMRCFAKDARANVMWVNSASEATTKSAAQEFDIEKWTLDYRDILADPAVEAVVIATPPYLHAEQFSAALTAGKHVLLEKPMAESADSVRKILGAANQAPGRVMIDASCRHTRLTRKFRFIKDIIDSGKLGKIYHIHHNHLTRGTFIEYNPNGAWAMNKKLAGGGPFIDIGVYDLSFHLGLLSDKPELKSVRSFARNDLRDMSQFVQFSDVEQHGSSSATDSLIITNAAAESMARRPTRLVSMAPRADCVFNSPFGTAIQLNFSISWTASHIRKLSPSIQPASQATHLA